MAAALVNPALFALISRTVDHALSLASSSVSRSEAWRDCRDRMPWAAASEGFSVHGIQTSPTSTWSHPWVLKPDTWSRW